MKEISFVKLNPSENMTILVKDQVPREYQRKVAAELLGYGSVYAEQVGFIEQPEDTGAWARLQMMGGEFCGSAVMSLSAVLAREKGLEPGEALDVPLEVSGAEELVHCSVRANSHDFTATLELPKPQGIRTQSVSIDNRAYSVGVVYMQGITHIIVEMKELNMTKEQFVEKIMEQRHNLVGSEAFGIMFYDRVARYLTPFVFVPQTNSMTWERSCVSGSAALALYSTFGWDFAMSLGIEISQPGGILRAAASLNNGLEYLRISGSVKIVAEGTAYVAGW